jgi:hypothetical protein
MSIFGFKVEATKKLLKFQTDITDYNIHATEKSIRAVRDMRVLLFA